MASLICAFLIFATAAACSPTANALPTALPEAAGSAAPKPNASGLAPVAAASGAVPSGAITDPAVAWPAFAACLRAHGLDVADPEVDDNDDPVWTSGVDLKRLITDQMLDDCGPIVAAVNDSGGRGKDHARPSFSFDSLVAHATCMREHGLTEWPDPDPDVLDAGMPAGFDKTDTNVLAALIACENLLVEATASPSPGL
jgi:hypothetical protein